MLTAILKNSIVLEIMTENLEHGFNHLLDLPDEVFRTKFEEYLTNLGYEIAEVDFERPWGGFFRISNSQANRFIDEQFKGIDLPLIPTGAQVSPKFLVVKPEKKLSWQLHDRRNEFWVAKSGPVGAYLSTTDEQPEQPQILQTYESIYVPVGTRHRLAGLEKKGIVAEIWIHTDPLHPSDELDIKRISDDFGRQSV